MDMTPRPVDVEAVGLTEREKEREEGDRRGEGERASNKMHYYVISVPTF
jgi:hypothetical protein